MNVIISTSTMIVISVYSRDVVAKHYEYPIWCIFARRYSCLDYLSSNEFEKRYNLKFLEN